MTHELREMARTRCDFCGGKSIAAEYGPLHRHDGAIDLHALPTRACLPCLLDPRPEIRHEPGDSAKGLVLSSGKVMTWTVEDRGPHHSAFGGAPQPRLGMPEVVYDLVFDVPYDTWRRMPGRFAPRLGRRRAIRVELDDLVAA